MGDHVLDAIALGRCHIGQVDNADCRSLASLHSSGIGLAARKHGSYSRKLCSRIAVGRFSRVCGDAAYCPLRLFKRSGRVFPADGRPGIFQISNSFSSAASEHSTFSNVLPRIWRRESPVAEHSETSGSADLSRSCLLQTLGTGFKNKSTRFPEIKHVSM